jgi:hypothetical protein
MRLLREPTAIDIPSGTADGGCVRRAEEDNEICNLLWGDKLVGGLFFGKKSGTVPARWGEPSRNGRPATSVHRIVYAVLRFPQ